MINIFDESLYGGWQTDRILELNEAMSADFYKRLWRYAIVAESDKGFGKSIKFYLDNGKNRIYKALDINSQLRIGDIIDLCSLEVKVLRKRGEKDIYRIVEKDNCMTYNDVAKYLPCSQSNEKGEEFEKMAFVIKIKEEYILLLEKELEEQKSSHDRLIQERQALKVKISNLENEKSKLYNSNRILEKKLADIYNKLQGLTDLGFDLII